MDDKKRAAAAEAAGIAASYINAKGQPQAISAATKQRLLAAMTPPPVVRGAPLPFVKVFSGTRKLTLPVAGKGDFHWRLQTERGREYQGATRAGDTLTLPPRLAHGYHQLTLTQGKKQWSCRVIVAPKRCWQPAVLDNGGKLWGACVQLYTLRSANNWGMGDFGDLQQLLEQLAVRGGAFVGLNPVHALYPAAPESASPYSPSSRRWLNVMYIDVSQVADFQDSAAAQRWWRKSSTRQALERARGTDWVDYQTVSELKLSALRLAWQHFCQREEQDSSQRRFAQFVCDGGDSLFYQAAYDALHGVLLQQDAQCWGWPAWPEALQQAQNPAVAEFCQQHPQEVRFWLWLQWLAHQQFAACWQLSQQRGMPLGLYRDLAVGVAEGGAETWCNRDLYCLQASVGAPPDILGPLGQNWGLPPLDPHVLQARAYQPFIDLLRANMTDCGALRIDHVMSMLRLWWIPYGETADQGAYVYYPVEDLMAILALESQRQRCMVIGEDLGTVPVEIIGKLRDSGVYSWKVLYFEQSAPDRYRAPGDWPRQSMASATTHDLPTLRGFWHAGDLALGEQLGLYPDKVVFRGLQQQRQQQRQALLEALHQYGCVPKRTGKRAEKMVMSPLLNRGMHRFLAGSGSALLGLQPEDWLDMAAPVNVPGTTTQYANWRRKLSKTLEEMFADDGVNRLLREVNQRRKKPV